MSTKISYNAFELSTRILDTTILSAMTLITEIYFCALLNYFLRRSIAIMMIMMVTAAIIVVYLILMTLKTVSKYSGIANIVIAVLQSINITGYCVIYLISQCILFRIKAMDIIHIIGTLLLTCLDLVIICKTSIDRSKRSKIEYIQ
jgi:hypothetical protein